MHKSHTNDENPSILALRASASAGVLKGRDRRIQLIRLVAFSACDLYLYECKSILG